MVSYQPSLHVAVPMQFRYGFTLVLFVEKFLLESTFCVYNRFPFILLSADTDSVGPAEVSRSEKLLACEGWRLPYMLGKHMTVPQASGC